MLTIIGMILWSAAIGANLGPAIRKRDYWSIVIVVLGIAFVAYDVGMLLSLGCLQ